ncbi:sigma-70 family RNA polymerase sigma factor (plasmid) [Embleya sp. NBC_00888]|uniref:sigma-70 family RNA polymerase sigma factor n=1 Tax=Embleya sp. NBC_00888 TaxID=2975960 RepID=UPI002F91360C|nr:sigma-70 family RNA polymerase sigma factor [Embleya sp. NBC_00888]
MTAICTHDRDTGSQAHPTPESELAELAELVYRRYSMQLLSFCLKLTGGDRPWAEDVVQETMLRAWRNADSIADAASDLMPWLATVARRIVMDDRRARRARPQECSPEPLEYVAADDQWEPLLWKMAVADALPSLTAAHREILTETLLRDRELKQAAEILGIPVGTVKSRIHYAIRALRQALDEGSAG